LPTLHTCPCYSTYGSSSPRRTQCWRRSALHRFFFGFHWCPLAIPLLSNSKNASDLIDDSPLTILILCRSQSYDFFESSVFKYSAHHWRVDYREQREETHLLLVAASVTSSADNDNERSDHQCDEQDQGRDDTVQRPLDTRCMAACQSNQHVHKSGHSVVELSCHNRLVLTNRDIQFGINTIKHIQACFSTVSERKN